MDATDKKALINNIELFRGLSVEEISVIADEAIERDYKEGELLFAENNPRKEIFLIAEGKVELFKSTAFGEEQRITFFTKYDFLGEGSLMEDSPHSTSARAFERSKVLAINSELFRSSGSIAVVILSNITKVVSRRMRYANTKMMNATAQYESGKTRREHDLLGEREVPYEYYYGVQTLRALENFNISGITLNFYPDFIISLAIVKMAATKANYELGILPKEIADAIVMACQEIMDNRYHSHFVVDMIQGGAGTSTNMNANEVIANRALEIMGKEKGQYEFCHPNNHVNLSQSTNDAYPTAIKIALIKANEKLVDVLQDLIKVLHKKAKEFSKVIKMGRTQLQDAVPMTLGQSFLAFAVTMEEEVQLLNRTSALFLEVNMGGTAIGTGINADPKYGDKVIPYLRTITGMEIRLARNLVEATQDTGDFITYSSALKRLATKLSKMSNDLRLMSSGPRAGLNEINLPPMQPGSTIMPGKVNPVIPEVVNQIAFKVIGNDLTVSMAAEAGQLELNVMEPVIVQSLFESIEMLKNGMKVLAYRCIDGITANEEQCKQTVQNSIGLVTALNPFIGYDASTLIAKLALESGRSVYELVLEKQLLSKQELDCILAPENMIH
ncbi:MAG: aspartate ammonia-lyase [Bacteroidetes bacterium HGW-Bacteroidetes-1]|jgi:aspartate ammonia-lyase|nr:MAG: aspartate ammonia-lyase [Bacteroidetes bacterium HGW-Bacteroidetes-1]